MVFKMEMTNQDYHKKILQAGIKPSVQRVAIYSYLDNHRTHPDAEEVFAALGPDYPTLSKTTVYNTMRLFEEKGLIQAVRIEDDKLRFDAMTENHLHFKCSICNKIFDIIDFESVNLINRQCDSILPKGFREEKIQTLIWGKCRECSDLN